MGYGKLTGTFWVIVTIFSLILLAGGFLGFLFAAIFAKVDFWIPCLCFGIATILDGLFLWYLLRLPKWATEPTAQEQV